MTDLEKTKLCAEAMGYKFVEEYGEPRSASITYLDEHGQKSYYWRPLTDDAQMAALVKKFRLNIQPRIDTPGWFAGERGKPDEWCGDLDLNRAVVTYVAKMKGAV
jgi:hypothetical protein